MGLPKQDPAHRKNILLCGRRKTCCYNEPIGEKKKKKKRSSCLRKNILLIVLGPAVINQRQLLRSGERSVENQYILHRAYAAKEHVPPKLARSTGWLFHWPWRHRTSYALLALPKPHDQAQKYIHKVGGTKGESILSTKNIIRKLSLASSLNNNSESHIITSVYPCLGYALGFNPQLHPLIIQIMDINIQCTAAVIVLSVQPYVVFILLAMWNLLEPTNRHKHKKIPRQKKKKNDYFTNK